jgi:hypothetical protein
MSDETLVFEHRHPVEGFLRFTSKDGAVKVDCRWPFDRDTGEWIFIGNDVAVDDYAACLQQVVANRRGRANGIDGGFIDVAERGSDKTQIEICDSAPHAPPRLALILAEPAEQFGRRLLDALGRS